MLQGNRKQGWLLKKAGSGIFSPWKMKYVVIEQNTMTIYDGREQRHPKHVINLEKTKITKRSSKWGLLQRGAVSFSVVSDNRKYYLAALTKLEFEEWTDAMVPVSLSFTRPESRMDNDDARSVYSVVTTADDYGISPSASRIDMDCESTVSSCVETLSFSSEPVLTSQELAMFGSEETKLTRKMIDIDERDIELADLIGSFQELSSFHAQNIIDEYHVVNSKERHTMRIYDFRADQSISRNGITFRFACDYDNCTADEIDAAMTRTSNELRSTNAVLKALNSKPKSERPQFYTVLMAIVDYKGFRIIAHADIQGPKFQLIQDLNPNRLKINEHVADDTKEISDSLNLKCHTVQVNNDRRVRVWLSATTEIHEDIDNKRFYLSSLRDIFPADPLVERGRLRPEFVKMYGQPLCADALSPTSGGSIRESNQNDDELRQASRFLTENWIPSFVKRLDSQEFTPYDSLSLTTLIHSKGINVRYLGLICQLSSIPFVRSQVLVEMVARVCKKLYRQKFRAAILHFRSVGATSISEQMATYVVNLVGSFLGNNQTTMCKIISLIQNKFRYNMDIQELIEIPKPALFLAIQYHCGLNFVDETNYDFENINRNLFIAFEPKIKTLEGIVDLVNLQNSGGEEKLAFQVAKHFKSLGIKAKLTKKPKSAAILLDVAAHYNNKKRFEEAQLYGKAATSSAKKNTTLYALGNAQLLYAMAGLQISGISGPDNPLLKIYRIGISVIEWLWGKHTPLSMTLNDRMSEVYHRAKDPERAFEFHNLSLKTANQCFGDNHIVTAAYLTRVNYINQAGCYLSNMGKAQEAIKSFTVALEIFQGSRAESSHIAEVHYHFADVLEQRGDYDGAVNHSQKCRKLREAAFGFSDVRVINSCRQLSKLLLAPYRDYKGILTPAIKEAYREAISCNEKIFRFLQNQQSLVRRKSRRSKMRGDNNAELEQQNSNLTIAGPLLRAPYGWTPPFPKNLLHRLTKEIVQMKLALVESPQHRECIRTLRQQRLDQELVFDSADAKETILKMAAVSPSVFLDDILNRIGHGDDGAVEELGMIIILTENETVGIRE